jgi:precorrin-6Y C5,15-methyltransferase (decarboxylating)
MTSARISFHQDMEQAVDYLQTTQGNILATTGSKQIEILCKLNGYQERVYLRVLPNVEMLQKCLQAGFLPSHIVCMQGPFSQELNELMLRQYDIKYLLTKQSGAQGGYPEKVKAACACEAELVVLAPPKESGGVSVEEMCRILATVQSRADG